MDPTGQSAHVLQRVVDGPPLRASRLVAALLVLLAYLPIAKAEIDRGLEDDTVKVLIVVVFLAGAVLAWGRWTDAFWMWR